MKISEIYEKMRKEVLKRCVFNAVAVVVCVLCWVLLIYARWQFAFIPAIAIGINSSFLFFNLKRARELEVKKRETEKMEEKLENLGRGQK